MDTLIISPESGITDFYGFKIVYTAENPYVLPYERYHADMQLVKIGDELIVAPMFYEYYRKMLPGKNIVCGETNPDGHYPKCVAYNTAVAKNFAVCNEKYTDRVILQRLKSAGMEIINVKQGYTKCSVCICGNSVITADRGIFKSISQKVDTLLISPGHINLPGCEYGFIGGASGFDKKLYFLGDISKHPDFYIIKQFLDDRKIEFEYNPFPLTDFGTAVFV